MFLLSFPFFLETLPHPLSRPSVPPHFPYFDICFPPSFSLITPLFSLFLSFLLSPEPVLSPLYFSFSICLSFFLIIFHVLTLYLGLPPPIFFLSSVFFLPASLLVFEFCPFLLLLSLLYSRDSSKLVLIYYDENI